MRSLSTVLDGVDYLTISDVHLHNMAGLSGKRMLAFIGFLEASSVEGLVLVGDIFDFILGSSKYFHRKFDALGAALTRLSQSGKRVVFIEGNHEFAFSSMPWQGVEVVPGKDFSVQTLSGLRLKFTHGDQIYAPAAYRYFRKVVRSQLFLFLSSLVPGILMDRIAVRGAKASRAQDQYRQMEHEKILEAMGAWLGRGWDYGVFGHFHTPYYEDGTGFDGRLVSMSCWEEPSWLAFGKGGAHRLKYIGDELLPSSFMQAESFFR